MRLALVLVDADGREAWRGSLPPHASERLVADTHMQGVLRGLLPNDGAPVRVDHFGLDETDEAARLRIAVGAGDASFAQRYAPGVALRDDVEVLLAQLVAGNALAPGRYGFRCETAPLDDDGGRLLLAPLPRRLPRLPRRSLFALGLTTAPRCGHPTLVMPRRHAERLLAHARASADVEVGALLVVEPCLAIEPIACALLVRVVEAVPLAHGTTGTATRLRVTPEALAAVALDEARGHCRGGLAHSHPFGDTVEAHALSVQDLAYASAFFWNPFAFQIVIDPRFTAPEDALATFCWSQGRLARVCCTFIEEEQEIPCHQLSDSPS